MLASGAVHCSVFVYLVDPGPFPPKARALVAPVPEPEGVTLACAKLFCSVQLVPFQVSVSAIVGEPLFCPPNTIALVLVPATEAPKPKSPAPPLPQNFDDEKLVNKFKEDYDKWAKENDKNSDIKESFVSDGSQSGHFFTSLSAFSAFTIFT